MEAAAERGEKGKVGIRWRSEIGVGKKKKPKKVRKVVKKINKNNVLNSKGSYYLDNSNKIRKCRDPKFIALELIGI